MAEYLYILFSDQLPKEQRQNEEHILLSVGFSAENFPEKNSEEFELKCSYCTTLIVNSEELEATLSEIYSTWWDLTGTPLQLELLVDDVSLMTKDKRKSLARLESGFWSFRVPCLLIKHGSEDAKNAARKFLKESHTRKKWQFWK